MTIAKICLSSHMFLELCSGGDLHAWLNAQTASSEPESRYIAYQLILGLEVSADLSKSRWAYGSAVYAFQSNRTSRQVALIKLLSIHPSRH